MATCTDCGKRINIDKEHEDFIDYVKQYYPDEYGTQFTEDEPEPFGVPLCCSCAIDTYESYLYNEID